MRNTCVALAIFALVGCSTPLERRQASGDFSYQQASANQGLVIPSQLQQPAYNTEFRIPEPAASVDATLVGQRLDIRPPLQILALAEGSRVQEGADNITVLIESNDDRDLANDINQAILGYLAERDIAVLTNANGQIVTNWLEYSEVIDSSWWKDQIYTVRQRYQFDTQVQPHQRTAAVTIQVIDHQEHLNGTNENLVLTDADKRRYAIDMLNGAISYLNFERNKRAALQELRNSEGFRSELGFDAQDNPAFVTSASFDQVWMRMEKLLPAMGFDVRDMDRQLGTLFVVYQPESGFWQNLWGKSDALPLAEGAYQVRVQPLGNGSSITFMDNNAVPLPASQVTEISNSFRELVQKELSQL
ncbi:MAG: outer membrane protein assembly factor BamC [Ferrimonas sp.]